jgi:hypothetical protein
MVWQYTWTFTQYVNFFTIACMVFLIIHNIFYFYLFPILKEKNKFMISLYHLLMGPLSNFQPLDHFYYACYECCAVGGHPSAVLLNFLQFVIIYDIHVCL